MDLFLAACYGGCAALIYLWYEEVKSSWLAWQELESQGSFEGTGWQLFQLVIRGLISDMGTILWRRLPWQKVKQDSLQRLAAAGYPANLTIQELWGWRCVAAAAGLGLLYCFQAGLFLAGLGGYLCSRLPYLWLTTASSRREAAIRRALPGVLDLLVICTGAGLTFDAAVAVIVEKSQPNPLIDELRLVLHHMRMGDTRQEALRRMSFRTQDADVKSVCATLIQADQLGTSISSTLVLLANQIRINQAQRAEARANQAPVKLLFPLVFFIFPSLLVVLFGPVFLGGRI
ncbi:MAG: type II secretion system F family protein [Firmicutes bacterium]|nr:type II secretion system F family protein [Bacillota bacterium]